MTYTKDYIKLSDDGWILVRDNSIEVTHEDTPNVIEHQRVMRYAKQIDGVWYYQDRNYVKGYVLTEMKPLNGNGKPIHEWVEGDWVEVRH